MLLSRRPRATLALSTHRLLSLCARHLVREGGSREQGGRGRGDGGRWGDGGGRRGDEGGRRDLGTDEERGQFRVLDIGKPKLSFRPWTREFRPRVRSISVDREKLMSPIQDWEAVWPTFRTFHPSVVPLPVRQGYTQLRNQVHPHKKGNVELMKIPNFLHLTPPVVSKQCKAIKKFCTKWPEGDVAAEFPTIEITSTYLNSSSSIRDLRSRVVTLIVPLDSLGQTAQSKEKLIRLAGDRYNPLTDSITIVTDSCPYRKQNSDYAEYLLTAIFHESLRREEWEEKKTEKDMATYTWSLREPRSGSQKHLQSVQTLLNEGENKEALDCYKKAVEELNGVAQSS